jgi:hypothetical protein
MLRQYNDGLTGWTAGVQFSAEVEDCSTLTVFIPILGLAQSPIKNVKGAPSLRVKRPGSEGDHSFPSTVEVKNSEGIIINSPYVFVAWYLIKSVKGNFTF